MHTCMSYIEISTNALSPIRSNKIVGCWGLIDFYTVEQNNLIKWKGIEKGLLIYTVEGYVSVSINRQPLEDKEFTEAEKNRLNFFYAGTYQIVHNIVMHKITCSNIPNLINKNLQ